MLAESGKPIVVVGSINVDMVAGTARIPLAGETVTGSDFEIIPGGKGANQAVAVARLGYPVQMVGKVGSDIFGAQMLENLSRKGVDTSAIGIAAGSTGVALIAVAADGENSIIVVPGANALVSPEYLEEHAEVIRGAGVVLAQLEIPLETVVRLAEMCRESKVPLILDPAPARTLPAELFSELAWFTPNETEAAFFTETTGGAPTIARSLLETGAAGVVLKMGGRGSYVATRDGEQAVVEAFAVKAVDTTAAGDAFNGAFATALMLGKSAAESGRFASAAAAISVTRKGAQPSMPTRPEVEAMLGQAH
jgi:ribokinase